MGRSRLLGKAQWVCLNCRLTVMASAVPRQCKKCRASSAWFKPVDKEKTCPKQ